MTEEENPSDWGCLAVGCSGNAEVAINEALSISDRWEMSIDFPDSCLRFAIPSLSTVNEFCDFLRCHQNKDTTGEHHLGSVGSANVSIISDDEFVDRFFICVSADDGAVRLTITGDDVGDLIIALEQAIVDLQE